MEIAICDDIQSERIELQSMLQEYFAGNKTPAEFANYEGGGALLSAFSKGAYELIFLDKWYEALCEVRTIVLKCGRTTKTVYIKDIIYIDVQGRNSTVLTSIENIRTSMQLTACEEMLPVGQFCRPIRYCLAAFAHIRNITEEGVLLDNGEKLAVSRLEKEKLREQFASYKLHQLRRR